MMDHLIEPDPDIEYRCECGECLACVRDWEFYFNEPSKEKILKGEARYEKMIYEPYIRIRT